MTDVQSLVLAQGDALIINGHAFHRKSLLNVEAKLSESTARNSLFFLLGCLGPIAAMVVFTVVQPDALRWGLGLFCAAGPFLAIIASFVWKKPWGVIIELPTSYRCVYCAKDQAEAESVAAAVARQLR